MKIKDLLSDETKWCQHAVALNEEGIACHATDTKAVRFCLIGSLYKCYSNELTRCKASEALHNAIDELYSQSPHKGGLSIFNDNVEFKDIRVVLEKANV